MDIDSDDGVTVYDNDRSDNWHEVMQNLKMAASQSLASGYYLAGTLALLGLVIAVVFMRSERQTEECDE